MDAFVRRVPAAAVGENSGAGRAAAASTQLRIDALPGVFHISSVVAQLRASFRVDAREGGGLAVSVLDETRLRDALQRLARARITLQVLQDTRVGEDIYRLRKATVPDVAHLAERLYHEWREVAHSTLKRLRHGNSDGRAPGEDSGLRKKEKREKKRTAATAEGASLHNDLCADVAQPAGEDTSGGPRVVADARHSSLPPPVRGLSEEEESVATSCTRAHGPGAGVDGMLAAGVAVTGVGTDARSASDEGCDARVMPCPGSSRASSSPCTTGTNSLFAAGSAGGAIVSAYAGVRRRFNLEAEVLEWERVASAAAPLKRARSGEGVHAPTCSAPTPGVVHHAHVPRATDASSHSGGAPAEGGEPAARDHTARLPLSRQLAAITARAPNGSAKSGYVRLFPSR